MRETKVETHLKNEVRKAGGITRKWVSPGRPGVPDQIVIWRHDCDACKAPVIHFVETKAPGKDAQPGQVREHGRLEAFACSVFVIDTIEKVDNYVKENK